MAIASKKTTRFDLESLPGGWVELREFNYGEALFRREIGINMSVEGGSRKSNEPTKTDIQTMQRLVTEYEFSVCIVDHNLENELGSKMDLGDPNYIRALPVAVGDEISDLIADLNDITDEEDLKEE